MAGDTARAESLAQDLEKRFRFLFSTHLSAQLRLVDCSRVFYALTFRVLSTSSAHSLRQNRTCLRERFSYVKKTPFCSFPSTETRFRVGSGVSDSKWKPGWSAVQLIVAPVLRNEPLKPCTLL